ncbi:MAG: linear amide C-N hydrolase [Bacteroidales bacterium]|nr:linear amide C-N hydrolase [Bacteroidales bacterium]
MRLKKLIIVLSILLTVSYSYACSTFVLKGDNQIVFGRNYDFDFGNGFIAINKKGVSKHALLSVNENPAEWISKYGSITFNQIGLDFPMGGMNEKGLVIAQMYLHDVKYPEQDKRKGIGELQWIQYQLDNSETLEDVIETDKFLRISNESHAPLHFLVCDKNGNMATFEYPEGELVVTKHNSNYVFNTNVSYETSVNMIKAYIPFGGVKKVPEKYQSMSDIVAIGNNCLSEYKSKESIIEYSFKSLSSVSNPARTQWSIVFDITNNEIYFKSLSNNEIRKLQMDDFNYNKDTKIRILDIQNSKTNLIHNQFKELNNTLAKEYLDTVFKQYNEKTNIKVEDNFKQYQYLYTLELIQ